MNDLMDEWSNEIADLLPILPMCDEENINQSINELREMEI